MNQDEHLRDYILYDKGHIWCFRIAVYSKHVGQNVTDHPLEYPLTAKAVDESFYVDDGLTGADSVEDAIRLQREFQSLFSRAAFLLRRWNCSESAVLQQIPMKHRDPHSMQAMPDIDAYVKTLGIDWNTKMDHI